MISLKKYLEMEVDLDKPCDEGLEPGELLPVVLESYRSAVLEMGKSATLACATVGAELQQGMTILAERLTGKITACEARQTEQKVEAELQRWGTHTSEYFKVKANEVKELLIVLARTAESMGERDQRYAVRFSELTTQLKTIANLEDLTQVRRSLVQRASEMKTYVDQMAQESQKSVATLQAEVTTYENKLKVAEQLALQDPLTGLANRRAIEERMEGRIAHRQPFSVVLLDLNRFKQVNDTYGHLAGDSLLQQFAQELRSNSRSADLAGRLSGDEFVLVLDGDLTVTKTQVERLQKWVFGEYVIPASKGKKEIKLQLQASVGVAQWQDGETMQQVLERADASMYQDKGAARKTRAT